MNRTKEVEIEGRVILVSVYESGESLRAEFCLKDSLAKFLKNDRHGNNPWEEMVDFKNPKAAIMMIGKEVIELAGGDECWLEGADERRQRVYQKMLARAGVRFVVAVDEFGDVGIRIN